MYTYNPILLPIYPRSLCHFPIIALHHLYLQYNNTTNTTLTFTYRYIVPSRRHLFQHSTSLYDLTLCPCLYSEGNFHCAPVSTQKAISLSGNPLEREPQSVSNQKGNDPLSLLRKVVGHYSNSVDRWSLSLISRPMIPLSLLRKNQYKITVDWPIDSYHRAMVHK